MTSQSHDLTSNSELSNSSSRSYMPRNLPFTHSCDLIWTQSASTSLVSVGSVGAVCATPCAAVARTTTATADRGALRLRGRSRCNRISHIDHGLLIDVDEGARRQIDIRDEHD